MLHVIIFALKNSPGKFQGELIFLLSHLLSQKSKNFSVLKTLHENNFEIKISFFNHYSLLNKSKPSLLISF